MVQQTDSMKYLGVIDNKLSWKPQISSLCRTLSQACGIVCKIRHFADITILRLIYFSLFHSHLQYCIIDCGRAYKTDCPASASATNPNCEIHDF